MDRSTRVHRSILVRLGIQVVAMIAIGISTARATIGPENLCLVVNSRSWASLTVANHYAAWRQIPAANIVCIDWPGSIEQTTLEEFRQRILVPVLATIAERGLKEQIDAFVYSSDFPFAVRYAEPTPANRLSVASLTSMTFFAPLVLAEQPPDFSRVGNPYAVKALGEKVATPSAFRSRIGRPAGVEGEPNYLSMMLAYTSGRGNSVREALAYLKRSAEADGTLPRGTIYYCQNSDVRSKTRDKGFAEAVGFLKQLGVAAQVLDGELPAGKRDVQGAMLGVAKFSWRQSGATIRPGAICEHLTSYGGILHAGKSQTPLSELLRYGAAGASGTVIEPFAAAIKFPDPMIHVFYARGATLSEAFYQSVVAPYQLLIVGDPLCAPWMAAPKVGLVGVTTDEAIAERRDVRLALTETPKGFTPARCDWYLDGLRVAEAKPDATYALDPEKLPPGDHELRAVVLGEGPTAPRARAILTFRAAPPLANHALTVNITNRAEYGRTLTLTAECPGAGSLEVLHASHKVGEIRGAKGRLNIDTKGLGLGPAALVVRAKGAPDQDLAVAGPIAVDVAAPAALVNRQPPVTDELARGLWVEWGTQSAPVPDTAKIDWLATAGVPAKTAYRATAWFDVDAEDLYQFQVRFAGELRLNVDGIELFSDSGRKMREMSYIPLSLARGRHFLELSGNCPDRTPLLDIRFGSSEVAYLNGAEFRHAEDP